MENQITIFNKNSNSFLQEIQAISTFLKSTNNFKLIKKIFTHIKVAKEIAKLKENSYEIKKELLKIELFCLKRYIQFENSNELTPTNIEIAHFFNQKTFDEIESIVEKYFKEYKSSNILYRHLISKEIIKINTKLKKESSTIIKEQLEEIIWHKKFTTRELAIKTKQKLFEKYKLPTQKLECLDDFHDIGIETMCREIIKKNKIIVLEKEIPKFLTNEENERTLFERAKMTDLIDAIALRQKQLQEDKNVLKNLEELFSIFDAYIRKTYGGPWNNYTLRQLLEEISRKEIKED